MNKFTQLESQIAALRKQIRSFKRLPDNNRWTPGMRKIRQTRGMARKIALSLRISPAAVSLWSQIPAERVISVERITGIRREELRPDLYPQES